MRTAARPLHFAGCVELRQTLDVHAHDERELMSRIAEVPADSVSFHTFGYFLRHHPHTTAYGNDFARWAALEIGDRALAERLAVVDPFAFPRLDALRDHLVAIIGAAMARNFDLPTYRAESEGWNVEKVVHVAAASGRHAPQEILELGERGDAEGHPDALIGSIVPTGATS